MANEKRLRTLLTVSVLMIIILLIIASILLSVFVLKPQFNAYVVQKQIQASDATINALLLQIQQQGYTTIQVGDQQIILAPVQPPA